MKISIFNLSLLFLLISLITSCRTKQEVISLQPARKIIDEQSKSLMVGFGVSDITPDLGKAPLPTKGFIKKKYRYTLAGYGRKRYARSIHDSLWARAVVFEKEQKRIGIVYLDLIGLHYNQIEEMRRSVPKNLKIDYLIIGATHNHEGPDTLGFWGRGLKSGIRNDYMHLLNKKVAQSLALAVEKLEPAEVLVAQGSIKDLNLTTDLRLPIVIPDILTVMQVKSGNTIIGNIVHWENHPEALGKYNTAITSDFPHFIRDTLEKKYNAPAIYWSGSLGGLMAPNPVITIDNIEYHQGNFEYAEQFGRAVGNRAIQMLIEAKPLNTNRLALSHEIAFIRIRNWRFQLGSILGILKRKLPKLTYVKTEVALFCLGDLHLQTIPGEIYPELVYGPLTSPPNADYSNAEKELPVIRELMQGKYNLILGLALDELGYIIPLNGWDNKKPYLGDRKFDSYGEELSPSRKFAKNLHEIVERLNNIVNNNN